jgi:hypothetical protein
LTLLENVEPARLNAREKELIAQRGNLNETPPRRPRRKGGLTLTVKDHPMTEEKSTIPIFKCEDRDKLQIPEDLVPFYRQLIDSFKMTPEHRAACDAALAARAINITEVIYSAPCEDADDDHGSHGASAASVR